MDKRVTWRGGRSRNQDYSGILSGSILLGKKWSGEWKQNPQSDNLPQVQIKTGWFDFDFARNKLIQPPVQLPNEFPDGVGCVGEVLTPSGSVVKQCLRTVIGDGTPFIGPMTWEQACRLIHVPRITSVDGYFPTGSASISGATTVTFSTGTEGEEPTFPFVSSSPLGRFYTPSSKGRWLNFYDAQFSAQTGVAGSYHCILSIDVGGYGFGNSWDNLWMFPYSGVYVAIDVDSPEDYYVTVDCSIIASVNGGSSRFFCHPTVDEEGNETGQICYDEAIPPQRTEIIVAQTVNVPYKDFEPSGAHAIETMTYSNTTATLDLGVGTPISFKLYYSTSVTQGTFDDGENPLPFPSLSLSLGQPKFKIQKWWKYKNADGEDVWDEDTGDMVNDALP